MSTRHARPGEDERVDVARRFSLECTEATRQRGGGRRPKPASSEQPFPGEAYLALGADALIVAGCTTGDPLAQDGLWRPGCRRSPYRGRENAKIRFAVLACAANADGPEVDLLDEVTWWGSDDYHDYAACAALALIRAGADRLGVTVAEFAGRLADRADIALRRDDGPTPP